MMNSLTARELASNGCIVFSVDHHDSSNKYVETDSGEDLYWDNSQDHYNYEWKNELMNVRSREISCLIDEIFENSYVSKSGFSETPMVNLDKLVLSGHSMGAMSCIKEAS